MYHQHRRRWLHTHRAELPISPDPGELSEFLRRGRRSGPCWKRPGRRTNQRTTPLLLVGFAVCATARPGAVLITGRPLPGWQVSTQASGPNCVAYSVGVRLQAITPPAVGTTREGRSACPSPLGPDGARLPWSGHTGYRVFRSPNRKPLWDRCDQPRRPRDNPRFFPRNPTEPRGPSAPACGEIS